MSNIISKNHPNEAIGGSHGCTERFMQENGKSPAFEYRAYIGVYVHALARDHETWLGGESRRRDWLRRQDTKTAYAVHENAFATRRLHESNGERFRALPLAFL